MKLTLEIKGVIKNVEIDGGAMKTALIAIYMWVQMGFPTSVCGVRSQMLA